MTREFTVRRKETKDEADSAVRSEVMAYLLGLNNPEWKWLIEPEVLFGNGGWRGYARIEWTKA